jgi:predicted secreted protein
VLVIVIIVTAATTQGYFLSAYAQQQGGQGQQQQQPQGHGAQERVRLQTRDPTAHNQILQERWRNQTEASGQTLHRQHINLKAQTIEPYNSDLTYNLKANGTATSFDKNSTENVSVTMQLAIWKSNEQVISMDIINGTIKIGNNEDESIRAGNAYYLPIVHMLRIYGLVPYEGQNGATYVKMLKVVSTISPSAKSGLPVQTSDGLSTFSSNPTSSRLDSEYYLKLKGEVTASAPTPGGAPEKETSENRTVTAGNQFNVTLDSNPTTGYKWQAPKIADESIAKFVNGKYVPPKTNLLGASGQEVFTFQAVKVGKTTITLEYARPFENSPIRIHTVQVTVQ